MIVGLFSNTKQFKKKTIQQVTAELPGNERLAC
jgi:hypothetical protein